MKLLTEEPSVEELRTVVERVLSSPHEADKWRSELEYIYLRMGGERTELVNVGLRKLYEEVTGR